MPFGDSGTQHVSVNGVPFRVEAETYEEAQQIVADMLTTAPELFQVRAKRLGLEQADLDALALRAEKGEGALKGLGRAEDAAAGNLRLPYTEGVRLGQGASKALIGAGRQFINHGQGIRQAVSELFGDVEGAKAIAREDEDERKLYQQLDEAGVGLEDLGEIGTDIGLFLPTTVLSGGTALPMFATGALLGAADVKGEVSAGNLGETKLEGGRLVDAGLGGTFALAGPILSKGRQLVSGAARAAGVGTSVRMAPNWWVRFKALTGNREAMVNIMDDALAYTAEGADRGKEILGRAALDKMQQMLAALPASAAEGLKQPAAMGVLRRAIKMATQPGSNGTNVFNPAVFEKEATELIGRVPQIFSKTEAHEIMAGMGQLVKSLQSLPGGVSPAAAERAAAALALAPERSGPILDALKMATNRDVVRSLMDSLIDNGADAMAALSRGAPSAAAAGSASNVATEGTEDIGEMISAQQRSR